MDTPLTLTDHTVAVYATHDQADAAIKILSDAGHEVSHLSIVGQDYATEERPVGFINTGDRMVVWGERGAFWGAVWGLFMGSAMMFLPGIGYVMFAGWLVAALEGALIGGGIGALAAALAGIGIPPNTVIKYQAAIKEGSYLVIVHGDEAEATQAMNLLASTPTSSLDSYTTR